MRKPTTAIIAARAAALALLLCAMPATSRAGETSFVDINIPFGPGASTVAGNYPRQVGRVSGVDYSFHRDGSGTFGKKAPYGVDGWTVGCGVDAMSDERWCRLNKDDLWLWTDETGRLFINAGTNHYPGLDTKLRIEKNKPLQVDADGWYGTAAVKLLERLVAAQTITTRYYEWPYKSPKDQETEMTGFAQAYRYIRWAIARQPAIK